MFSFLDTSNEFDENIVLGTPLSPGIVFEERTTRPKIFWNCCETKNILMDLKPLTKANQTEISTITNMTLYCPPNNAACSSSTVLNYSQGTSEKSCSEIVFSSENWIADSREEDKCLGTFFETVLQPPITQRWNPSIRQPTGIIFSYTFRAVAEL